MPVGAVQCRGDLDANIEHAQLRHHLAALNPGIQVPAIGQLHHKVAVVLRFVKAVNMNDIAMAQTGRRLGFTQEGFHRFGVIHQLGLHQLDGHFPLQHRVKGPENGPHPSLADHVAQLKLPEPHRHHDRILTFGAPGVAQGRLVILYEYLRATASTIYHFQRDFFAIIAHTRNPSIIPASRQESRKELSPDASL